MCFTLCQLAGSHLWRRGGRVGWKGGGGPVWACLPLMAQPPPELLHSFCLCLTHKRTHTCTKGLISSQLLIMRPCLCPRRGDSIALVQRTRETAKTSASLHQRTSLSGLWFIEEEEEVISWKQAAVLLPCVESSDFTHSGSCFSRPAF